jgi:hypothetical protein
MGLEGAYFETPVLFLALEDLDYGVAPSNDLHLSRFIRQYHNERYMLAASVPNVVTRCAELRTALVEALADPRGASRYNATLSDRLPLKPLREIARELVPSGRMGVGSGPVESLPEVRSGS